MIFLYHFFQMPEYSVLNMYNAKDYIIQGRFLRFLAVFESCKLVCCRKSRRLTTRWERIRLEDTGFVRACLLWKLSLPSMYVMDFLGMLVKSCVRIISFHSQSINKSWRNTSLYIKLKHFLNVYYNVTVLGKLLIHVCLLFLKMDHYGVIKYW